MGWPNVLGGDTPSNSLITCVPGNDVSATFLDVSDNIANLVVEAGNTDAFSVAGKFTTTAGGTTGGLNIPKSKLLWNPYKESIIVSFLLTDATPAGNETIFAIGGNELTTYDGFYLSHRAGTGALRLVPIKNGVAATGTSDTATSVSGTDVPIVVAYDAFIGTWYLFINGNLSNTYTNVATFSGFTFNDAISDSYVRFGGFCGASVTISSVSGKNLQIAKKESPLPISLTRLVKRLYATPSLPITNSEW